MRWGVNGCVTISNGGLCNAAKKAWYVLVRGSVPRQGESCEKKNRQVLHSILRAEPRKCVRPAVSHPLPPRHAAIRSHQINQYFLSWEMVLSCSSVCHGQGMRFQNCKT